MEQEIRNKLQRATQHLRKVLEQEFAEQLEGSFDILPDGNILANEGKHLDPRGRLVRQKLVEAIEHIKAGGKKPYEAVAEYTREAAFTFLNRFIALRMLEARGLLQECVSKGDQSSGFKEFSGLAPGLASLPDAGYRLYLECLFDELSVEIKVLFDRRDPSSLLWPRRSALMQILQIIDQDDLAGIWTEDETIGWVYQYFNSSEERKQMRDESSTPRNGRELAVRNQFFTPRYVVQFLTDNTLGRIWYEMQKGDTRLVNECRYLVRYPSEVFLEEGQEQPKDDTDAQQRKDLSQEELVNKTIYIRHRPKKDPRDLKILDPACGSGHFLLYAFDLLITIYEEAWRDKIGAGAEVSRKHIRDDYTSLEQLYVALPGLVLRHNLHGIDIDPRAAQIAALALWMRAQRAHNDLHVPRTQRPPVAKLNIACAEPMPGEQLLLNEFVERQLSGTPETRLLAHLVRRIFDEMTVAGEIGSLLPIEEKIADTVSKAKTEWLKQDASTRQMLLQFHPDERGQRDTNLDVSGITDEMFWEGAENRIYSALRTYSSNASNNHDTQRRLFAEDAAKGIAFIDTCQTRYDVVLMNPPFGDPVQRIRKELDDTYPTSNGNMLCAFIERGWKLLNANGCMGAIYDRTAVVKSTYEEFRRKCLVGDDRLFTFADLGWGVLDANVETCTSILFRRNNGPCMFFDARSVPPEGKGAFLAQLVTNEEDMRCLVFGSTFQNYPNAVIGYDFPDYLRHAFAEGLSLSSSGFRAYTGHQFRTEQHFRLWWEVSHTKPPIFHARLFNGAGFTPYVALLRDVLIAETKIDNLPNNSFTNLRNKTQHQLPGICFGKRGEHFCAHVLPRGLFFSLEGLSIPVSDPNVALEMLGVLNTPLTRAAINRFAGQHKTSGYVNLFPYRPHADLQTIRATVEQTIEMMLRAQQLNETSPLFPGLAMDENLSSMADNIDRIIRDVLNQTVLCEDVCSTIWQKEYQLCDKQIADLQAFRQSQPSIEIPVDGADLSNHCQRFAAEYVLSFAVGCMFGRWDIQCTFDGKNILSPEDPFQSLPDYPPSMLFQGLQHTVGSGKNTSTDTDYPSELVSGGIAVDDPGHSLDLSTHASNILRIIWVDNADSVIHEVTEKLGVSTIREYFRKTFFEDHVFRYSTRQRKAPIYWQIGTPGGSYCVWLYYQNLTKDTFFNVRELSKDKLKHERQRLDRFRTETANEPTRSQRTEIEEQEKFVSELAAFTEEVERITPLWNPNLNDGVIINFAPLWRLVSQNKPWQDECKSCWDKLVNGDYDWAHLAMYLWPERVVPKCRIDTSLAIAHGLQEIFWQRDGRDRFQPLKEPEGGWDALISELVKQRTSPAVKAALQSLLTAPTSTAVTKSTRKRKIASS